VNQQSHGALYKVHTMQTSGRTTLPGNRAPTMKTPWTSTLAWLAAVAAALVMAWAAPDEASILRQSGGWPALAR
jgi:hypothetical protein